MPKPIPINTYLHTVQQKIRIYISYYKSIPTNVIGTAGCIVRTRTCTHVCRVARCAHAMRGRWSCLFLRDAFQSQNKEREQRHRQPADDDDNARAANGLHFSRITDLSLAHHSRFSLQSVASVESCCRTLLRGGALLLEGPRLRNFLCTDGFRKIRIPSHPHVFAVLERRIPVPLFHCSTVPLFH